MNEAGLTKKFVDEQREKLLKLKTTLMNEMKAKVKEEITDTEKDISEEGELAQTLTNQNVALRVHEQTLRKLREIDLALQKIEMGTYGVCEETGDPIEMKRLKRTPWARLSIAAAEELERESNKYHRVG